MTTSLLFAALLALGARQSAPAPGAPAAGTAEARPEEGWALVDRVEIVVNEDIVTRRSLMREMMLLQRKGQLTSQSNPREAEGEVRTNALKRLLAVQAGEKMGLDRALVDRQVNQFLRRQRDHFDGVVGLAEHLESRDIDAQDHRREVERDLYQLFWTNYVTGEGPATQGARISVDRYVRPGLRLFEYRNLIAQPEQLPAIGGHPQRVTVQLLYLDPGAIGVDLAAARKLAVQLRERVLDGEDMALLNDQYGASKKRSSFQPEPLDEARLKQLDPALGEFVAGAQPGDVSEVMTYATKERGEIWRIVRLVAREESAVPDIGSLDVQHRLTELYDRTLADYRLETAFGGLFRAAYVWQPEPGRSGQAQAPAPEK